MERSHYSGKAGRHTAKVQYTTTAEGLILHKTRHSPGRTSDIGIYRMKHPSFPELEPGGRNQVTIYADRGYVGAPETTGASVCTPIKRKPRKKLTMPQKEYNRLHSKIRVYVEHAIRRVKQWRIMGNTYRNPLKKYDTVNDIVCGLVNYRIMLVAGRAT